MIRRSAAFLSAMLLLGACETSVTTPPDVALRVEVDDAWVRPVSGADTTRVNSAAYFTLANQSADTLRLLGARSEVAARTEIHETTMEDGVVRMRPVQHVVLAPRGRQAFEPGGLHLMLVDLQRDLAAGESLSITFQFDDGTEEVAPFLVRPAAL